MLKRLLIRDFQCHGRLEVVFDPLYTVLSGVSDAGKSAVLRALRWVCLNQPSGDSFIRRGADACSVLLEVDGHKIVRRKGNGVNLYKLDGKVYKSFGQGCVPEPIANILRVGGVVFQGQHDAPFWFSDTPGQVSKQLNSIVNLGAIDSALGNVASEVRKAGSVADVTRERLESARRRKADLGWVRAVAADMADLESKHTEWQARALELRRLRDLLEVGVRAAQTIKVGHKLFTGLQRLSAVRSRADATAEHNRGLRCLIDDYRQAEQTLCATNEKIVKLEHETREKFGDRCPTCGGKWSPSLSPTSTCPTSHRRPGAARKTGTPSRPDTCDNSTPW